MIDPKALAAAAAIPLRTVFDDTAPELARTYSEAILNVAENEGQVDEVLDELEAIQAELIDTYPMFGRMMNSPVKSMADKDAVLVSLFEGKALPTVVKSLRVLNRHGRLDLLGAIVRAARKSWEKRQDRTGVIVRSAVPLDDSQLDAIRDRLAKSFQTTPVLKLAVDPSLIGGLIIQIGDDVYDASVRNRLERLRQRLTEGTTNEIQSRRNYVSDSE